MNEVTSDFTPEQKAAQERVYEIQQATAAKFKGKSNYLRAVILKAGQLSKSEDRAMKEAFEFYVSVFGEEAYWELSTVLDETGVEEVTIDTVLAEVLKDADPKV